MPVGAIRVGSLTARIAWNEDRRGEDVAWLFGTSLIPPDSELARRVDVDIAFTDSAPEQWPTRPHVPDDGIVLGGIHRRREIHTEALSAAVDLEADPARVDIAVVTPGIPHFDLCVHLAVVLHKLLFLLDRVVLHAAAVRLAGRVSMFLGEKGAGKTTSALRLARAGATVLAEDHVILKRCPGGFCISGCDERSRMDAKTERFFFREPLAVAAADFAGTLKKEVPAREVFDSQPYTDYRPDLVFFPRVGETFAITPLSRQAALLKLMRAAGKLQRFVDPTDTGSFLEMLSDFVQTTLVYDLELSPDLHELDRLVEFLQRNALADIS